jgi:hypothetical protein
MTNGKRTKGQITIYKTLHRKLKTEHWYEERQLQLNKYKRSTTQMVHSQFRSNIPIGVTLEVNIIINVFLPKIYLFRQYLKHF